MAKKYRYTGELPPASVLKNFPNWVQAVDEEGEDGQDETTIRPDTVIDHIAPQTEYTAADITLASGKKLTALLGGPRDLWNGNVESIAVYEGDEIWHIDLLSSTWSASAYPEGNANLIEPKHFPATVNSRLPGVPGGKLLKLELLPKGKLARSKISASDLTASVRSPFKPRDISAKYTPDAKPPNHETPDGQPSADWMATMKKEIGARGYFSVDLWSSFKWKKRETDPKYEGALRGKPHVEVDEVVAQALLPVLARAKFCRVYNLDANTPKEFESVPAQERKQWLGNFIKTRTKETFLDLATQPPSRDNRFWWWLIRRSRGLVAGVPVGVLQNSHLIHHGDYPNVITNLGAVLDQSVIRFAKTKSAQGDQVCVCPDKRGGIQLHILGRVDVVLDLFDRAVKAPRPDWIFPKMYSRYWVLTFEQNTGLNFLFEAEKEKTMEFLLAAVNAAISNLNHPATILRALGAAEIVAVANGKPAAIYNGHKDRSIDRTVLRLGKKIPKPSLDVLKHVRDVVSIIADYSPAPKEIWLSNEGRRLWRTRQIDLHARLK